MTNHHHKQKPINIWKPKINGKEIRTIPTLHQIIEKEFPGLRRNPHFPRLLIMAEQHLILVAQLHQQTHLKHGKATKLAREIGINGSTARAYIYQARHPQLYELIKQSLSKGQAQTRIAQIHKENRYIQSLDAVQHQLTKYYLTPFHELNSRYPKLLDFCELYFEAIHLLKDGGSYRDVARRLKVSKTLIMKWYDGARPLLVDLARHIPHSTPKPGCKWLPLQINQAYRPSHFIQVPNHITHPTQINEVLTQLQPINNKDMSHWKLRFGRITKLDAFYYLLGIIVSDAEKTRRRTSSTLIDLTLSKKYAWSKLVGQATCYYFGRIGIAAKRKKDRKSTKGVLYRWRSEKNPLITWIIRTCIGLQPHETTTYDSIKCNWILNSPDFARAAFLQGLNDGDGSASVTNQCFNNACGPNNQLVEDLFNSFRIKTNSNNLGVWIRSQKGLIRAVELPLFRHATGRQKKAEKLAEMMRTRQQQEHNLSPPEMIQEILKLREGGYSLGEIAEVVFDKFGISLSPSGIGIRIRNELN